MAAIEAAAELGNSELAGQPRYRGFRVRSTAIDVTLLGLTV